MLIVMINILYNEKYFNNNSFLGEIGLWVYPIQEKLKFTQHQSPKQRLRAAIRLTNDKFLKECLVQIYLNQSDV
jgi:hypothetical protein